MSETKLLSLTEIFNNRIFRVPDYQRGYSWQEEQLEEFWDDIMNLSPNKIHYVGMLTVEKVKEVDVSKVEKWNEDQWLLNKGMSAYYVIDGQQRLTTFIILLHEILREVNDDEGVNYGRKSKSKWVERFLFRSNDNIYKSFMFGYEKDNPSDEFFKTKILEQKSSAADKYPETLYTANLMAAKEFFAKKLGGISKEEKEVVFDKAVNRLKFNYYEIDESLDVFVTFETMNNRGRKLSVLELLKNRMVYLSTLLYEETKVGLRRDINETWKTIYEYLGKNKDKVLSDDNFLYHHWIMYFGDGRIRPESYENHLLKREFTYKNVVEREISFLDIKEYIDSLSICVKKWFYIHYIEYSDYSCRIKEYVEKLKRIGWSAFLPLTMAVFAKEEDESLILRFLEACEKFVFLVFKVSRRPSYTKKNYIYRIAGDYYDGYMDIESVIEEIGALTYGDDERYSWLDLDNFVNHIRDLYRKNEKGGFYSWDGLKYFLYEYELKLKEDAGGCAETKVSWSDFVARGKEETIEHIYPQTATDLYWKSRFGHLNKRKKALYLNSLGNLLLLSREKNSSLQNADFENKKNGKRRGYYNGSYSEIEVSKQEEWTPDKIMERGVAMLEFMEQRWDFTFEEWGINKLEVLFPAVK